MRWLAVPSPIGTLGLAVERAAICAVQFSGPRRSAGAAAGPAAGHPETDPLQTDPLETDPLETGLLEAGVAQLAGYFAGERTEFDLPMVVRGGSDFEQAVWARIAAIPYGHTATYGEIARAVGVPDGARAVGVACNRNPVPILVPCHRVVGAGGKLVGFGGGLPRKRFLLELEAGVCIIRDFSSGG